MVKPMSKRLFAIVMFFSLPAFPQSEKNKAFDKLLYTSERGSLPYRLLKPERLDLEQKYPLIIFLHGAGERGEDNEVHIRHIAPALLDPENRASFPCFVLAPQCPSGIMWANHDREGSLLTIRDEPSAPMKLLLSLLKEVENKFPIDPSRVYLTGLSMGGFGTWDLLARFPKRFAAAVPICGGGDLTTASDFKDVPIWAFHGALDKVVPPGNSRSMVKALQEAGGTPGYTEYPDVGHNSWSNAYKDPYLLPWLFQQSLVKRPDAK